MPNEEMEIASFRRDGRLRKPVTIWLVRDGDNLYVQSAVKGRDAAGFRALQERHEGIIQAGGPKKEVTFADAGHDIDDKVDHGYRAEYARYAGTHPRQRADPRSAIQDRQAGWPARPTLVH